MIGFLLLAAMLHAPPPPTPEPLETPPFGSEYYADDHSCITNGIRYPWPPKDMGQCFPVKGYPSVLSRCIAYRAYLSKNYGRSIQYFKTALAQSRGEHLSSREINRTVRLPLSLALYRSGRIAEARRLWRGLLQAQVVDDATLFASSGQFARAFVSFAQDPPGYNTITMRDSGARYNLQRGLYAAAKGRYSDARTYLGYALECTPSFVDPPLVLGVLDMMQKRRSEAIARFIQTLEGAEADPPDTASILPAQYDAMHLLLRLL